MAAVLGDSAEELEGIHDRVVEAAASADSTELGDALGAFALRLLGPSSGEWPASLPKVRTSVGPTSVARSTVSTNGSGARIAPTEGVGN